jgi:hypothetical protein
MDPICIGALCIEFALELGAVLLAAVGGAATLLHHRHHRENLQQRERHHHDRQEFREELVTDSLPARRR